MSEKEFLDHKEAYVRDVLAILEKRAGEEADLIFERRRRQDPARPQPYTEDQRRHQHRDQRPLLPAL